MGEFVLVYMVLWGLCFAYSEYNRDQLRVKREDMFLAFDPNETQVLHYSNLWHDLEDQRERDACETERLGLGYSEHMEYSH